MYVADGLGSGFWTSLGGTQNPFANSLMQIVGGSATNITDSIFGTRILDTVISNQIINASLFTNRITLPAGTYYVQAECPVSASIAQNTLINFSTVSRLQNITDSTTALNGLSSGGFAFSLSSTLTSAYNTNFVTGKFTIGATKVFEFQSKGISSIFGALSFQALTSNVFIWKMV